MSRIVSAFAALVTLIVPSSFLFLCAVLSPRFPSGVDFHGNGVLGCQFRVTRVYVLVLSVILRFISGLEGAEVEKAVIEGDCCIGKVGHSCGSGV
jgi:hypothetical protein